VDVEAWLRGLGLGRYERVFRDNDIDAGLLPTLTADDLRELGVASLGHRKRLLAAIATLAGPADPQSASPAPVPPPASTVPQAERRQLTVMFVDLVGSTALSRRLDPEEMSGVLRAYQDAVAGGIARFDGHVAKFLGDGVLCYFGWPKAQEDAAERAVRAALALADAVGRLAAPDGGVLACRVGIATGMVVVGELIGEGTAQEQAVVGETPNLAARLQTAAAPGEVVVAAATRRLLGGLFEVEPMALGDLRGFEGGGGVEAFRILGEGRAEGRFEALRGHAPTPLVGRERELAVLLDRWARAEGGRGQVVQLCGEPGIGKSRLVQALRERVLAAAEPPLSLGYQCSPHHAASVLWPVAEQLKRAAGVARGDPPGANLDRLEALLGRAVTEGDVAMAAPLIADLLSLPGAAGRYPPRDLTPQRRKELTLEALLAQLEGLASKGPVLVVLEDAHWADPTSLELFYAVVRRLPDLPVLLVVTFRPEFRAPWAVEPHVATLALGRLGAEDARALAERVAGGRTLRPELLEAIRARTDGVPLFVEELTKAVLESDAPRGAAGGPPRPGSPLPEAGRTGLPARRADGPARPADAGAGAGAGGGGDRARVRARAPGGGRRNGRGRAAAGAQRARHGRAGLRARRARAGGDLQLQARAGAGRGLREPAAEPAPPAAP
jgi:class 3 adenylate cyclase